MKKAKILYKTIFIMLLIMSCCSCVCYARYDDALDSEMGGGSPNTSESESKNEGTEGTPSEENKNIEGLPNLNGNYKPIAQIGTGTKGMVSTILSVLTIIGMIVAVIGIALVGFNTILGSASEKAAGQEKYVGIIVAALLITSGSAIAKLIIDFAEKAI